ncbi:sulfurtransferase [Candidatus Bathyarchaeota archaeon]|nr:sulfurtransferase [Candidatus Bathyarchaeota archaeon]
MTTSQTCRSLEEQSTDSLVETHWLAQHLEDQDIRVIEIDPAPLPPNNIGHIPNSVVLDWRRDLWHGTSRDFVTGRDFQSLMERSGVTNDTTVICCSLVKQFSTYLFWFLRYNDHKKVKVLNGGLQKWISDRLPLTSDVKTLGHSNAGFYRPASPNINMRALRDYVLTNMRNRDLILIDARTPQEFRGELINVPELPQEGSYCAGHIPGAEHVFFEENFLPDGRFKPSRELKQIYISRGIRPDKEIVAYCRSGHRATVIWFVLTQLLGYPNVRVYDGSWTEWGNLVGAPIEKA